MAHKDGSEGESTFGKHDEDAEDGGRMKKSRKHARKKKGRKMMGRK